MMEIDKSKWVEFNFYKIFWLKRGRRLITQNQIEGEIAYISSSKKNNGIDNYITPPDYMTVYKNAITLNNSGSIGYCFYHTYNFVASDHCTILKIRDKDTILDIYLFLFLKPIIETMKDKYGFAREMSDNRLKNEKIELPAQKRGNRFYPDWDYMREFIKHHSPSVGYHKKIEKPTKTLKLNNKDYAWFSIAYNKKNKTGLFQISVGTDKDKVLQFIENSDNPDSIVYEISNTASNNGINEIYTSKKFNNKNTITLATRGNDFKAFYHEYDVIPIVRVINLKSVNFELNKYNALFLCTILEKGSYKFSYGRFLSGKNILKEKILLPIDKNKNPDWAFMENYIKSLPYSSNL
jgi:Type I restriction modification DNA specificity domain